MIASGRLQKMTTRLESPVSYELRLGEHSLPLNDLLGARMQLRYEGEIRCVACDRLTGKSFRQGYCFPCTRRLAACDICMVKPELCHYSEGTCREPQWGDEHCMQAHVVYLTNTSSPKVGITRKSQIPTRWIDQGATRALPFFEVPSRHQSGVIEACFARRIPDRTNWRRMLAGPPEDMDLAALRDSLIDACGEEIQAIAHRFGEGSARLLEEARPVNIEYPVLTYPTHVRALSFEKTSEIEGVLQGIKGQYLLLDSGVINIRKFTSYTVSLRTH